MPDATGPLAGEPRERQRDLPAARRVRSWLVWWVLMMSFWVMIDDSISTDELLAGAGAAALAALLAELVTYQAATRFRMRIEWLVPALRLPGQVARDTVIVYRALWRRLVRGEQSPSAFLELPARFGDDTSEGLTRRTLLIGGTSVAPNTFVLGIDKDRDVMVVHRLVEMARMAAEETSETESGKQRTPLTMIIPPVVLVAGAAVIGLITQLGPAVQAAAIRFEDQAGYDTTVLAGARIAHPVAIATAESTAITVTDVLTGTGSVAGALVLAWLALYWRRLPLLRRGYEPGAGLTAPIQRFQSGVANDYVTWIVLGLACLGGVLALVAT